MTGASRGIGRAIALALAEDGFIVVAHYARNRAEAEITQQTVVARSGTCHLVCCDLGDDDGPRRLVGEARRLVGGIDVLVNNAAVLHGGTPEELSREQLEQTFAVNVLALYRLVVEARDTLVDGGAVINISSDASRLPRASLAAYAASKAAVNSLTLSFAEWLGPRGISVNAVAPGPVRTEMLEPVLADPAAEQAFVRSSARQRIGEVDDITPIVRFLAGQESGWVNGRTVEATGGRTSW